MNTFKKTLVTLGIITLAIPQIANALDTEGTQVVGTLNASYQKNFVTNKTFEPGDLATWMNTLRGPFVNYIVKNSTVAGIKDKVLIQSLSDLLAVNTEMINAINKSRNVINERSTFAADKLKTQEAPALRAIGTKIINIENTLKNESYLIPGKRNAREALLSVLDLMKQAIAAALQEVSKNIYA